MFAGPKSGAEADSLAESLQQGRDADAKVQEAWGPPVQSAGDNLQPDEDVFSEDMPGEDEAASGTAVTSDFAEDEISEEGNGLRAPFDLQALQAMEPEARRDMEADLNAFAE